MPRQFSRPDGIEEIEISLDGGSMPSPACPGDRKRKEIFAAGQGPLGPEYDFHQMVRIDTSTNARATEYCPPELVRRYYFTARFRWPEMGRRPQHPQPPAELCAASGPGQITISQPAPGVDGGRRRVHLRIRPTCPTLTTIVEVWRGQ
jgi:hypothetical protein